MPLSDSAHRDRARAESFGAVAADYDRFRPSYPDALVDELVGLAGDAPVLDVGTGTGKAARLLADRGVDVLGVEVDPQMAAVARTHGLTVEVGSFESWPDAGRRFGLITAAQAWHWVDPDAGARKVCRLLRPGGVFSPFWNFYDVADDALDVLRGVYGEHAPELLPQNAGHRNRPQQRPYVADLQRFGSFERVDFHVYRWTEAVPVDEWVGRVGTHSDHLALGAGRLGALQGALRDALAAAGPHVHTTGGTYVVTARMAG